MENERKKKVGERQRQNRNEADYVREENRLEIKRISVESESLL